MRLVKLSSMEFPTDRQLESYFATTLLEREPTGLFRFPKGWIGEDGLDQGETLLFSYRGRLRFVAKAATGRMDNTDEFAEDYPCCFVIDMKSLRRADVELAEVERQFRAELGLDKSLARSQGWPIIPDSERAEDIINSLISS